MKTKLLFAICMLSALFVVGQNEISKSEIGEISFSEPTFTGTTIDFTNPGTPKVSLISKYLAERLEYPESASKQFEQGTEVVKFTVTAEGKLTNFEVLNSVCPEIDEEMIRVLQTTNGMWKPGITNGEFSDMEKEVSMVFFVSNHNDEKAAETFKERATNFFNLGNQSLLTDNNPKKALKYYSKAMVYLPYEGALLFSRGVAKYALNDIEGAEQDWERYKAHAQKGETQENLEPITENLKNLPAYKHYQSFTKK